MRNLRKLVWGFRLIVLQSLLPFGDSLSQLIGAQSSSKEAIRRPQQEFRRCVVVGGGPVGLAAALTLSNSPHCFNVTVLEKTTDEDLVSLYDPGKAYLYNIGPRGLQWVSKFPRVLDKVLSRGYSPVSGVGKILQVPGDPFVPIPPVKDVAIAGNVTFDARSRSVWIPRHLMVDLMMESCQEHEDLRRSQQDAALGSISIELGKDFSSISPREDGTLLVECVDGSTYGADLVVGADGINSAVRNHLSDASKSTWLQSKAKSFRIKQYASPSAGLRLKSLQIPADFAIPNGTDATINPDPTSLVALRSVNTGVRSLSLGMLPVKDANFVRPANVIARPDHEIWSAPDGAATRKWMQESFPRLPFDEWFNMTEWDRFVKAKGLQYPKPQYSPGSAVPSPTGETGVVLVGDACHAFPPDIGQGINAGLQDVQALDRALQGQDIKTGEPQPNKAVPKLIDALLRYQANRGPEHRALIRMARFGAPYQYNQSWLRDRIGKKVWFVNFLARTLLSKLTLGIIPPHSMVLMSNARAYTYREIMRRCDAFNLIVRFAGVLSLLRFAFLN